ncbi:MAG TPA: sensor domain-containing diguanylate cyclase [Stellaceae bacterium]|nr:sensor domain-containing diguanylate cyclase [Stellaceae bacterium]
MAIAEPSLFPPPPAGDRALRQALAESRQRYKDLVEISSDFAWETDASERFSFVSPRGALGWNATDLLGRDPAAFLDNPANAAVFAARGPVADREIWFRRADGELACLSVAAKPVRDADGAWVGARGLCRDVSEWRRHERELAEARLHDRVMTRIVRSMRDDLDPADALMAAISALGLAAGAAGGAVLRGPDAPAARWGEGAPSCALDEALARLGEASATGFTCEDLHFLVHAARFRQKHEGAIVLWKEVRCGSFGEDDRALLADVADYLGVALAQIAALEQIIALSRTDALTSLLNRRAFVEELDRRLARLKHDAGAMEPGGALMFIDLDNFKRVNDALGHAAGDRALRGVADALRHLGRSGDLIGRLGGDEFVLWIDRIPRTTAMRRAQSLLRGFGVKTQAIDDPAMRMIGMSIGLAFVTGPITENASEIIARADVAMYRAKEAGKQTIVVAPHAELAA